MMYAVGAGIILFLLLAGTAGATQMSDTQNPGIGGNASAGPLSTFADAIAHAEGFYVVDSLPARNHNPGDLRDWPGAASDANGYSVFATDGDGWAALEQQLNAIRNASSRYYSLGMSIAAMGAIYAGGDPGGNWASNVASFLGASINDPIGNYL